MTSINVKLALQNHVYGVDFSEATPEARFIFRHTAGRLSPLRGLFLRSLWGLTPLNFSKQNLKLKFMGSDPLTKFLK